MIPAVSANHSTAELLARVATGAVCYFSICRDGSSCRDGKRLHSPHREKNAHVVETPMGCSVCRDLRAPGVEACGCEGEAQDADCQVDACDLQMQEVSCVLEHTSRMDDGRLQAKKDRACLDSGVPSV